MCSELRGVRLGRVERAILLGAGRGAFATIPAIDPNGNADTAVTRARGKLERAGLIEVEWSKPQDSPRIPVRRRNRYGDMETYTMYRQDRLYRLTALGERVVEGFAEDLAAGRRLRWERLRRPTDVDTA